MSRGARLFNDLRSLNSIHPSVSLPLHAELKAPTHRTHAQKMPPLRGIPIVYGFESNILHQVDAARREILSAMAPPSAVADVSLVHETRNAMNDSEEEYWDNGISTGVPIFFAARVYDDQVTLAHHGLSSFPIDWVHAHARRYLCLGPDQALQFPTQEGCLWTEEIEAAEEDRPVRAHEWDVLQPMTHPENHVCNDPTCGCTANARAIPLPSI